MVAAPAPMKSLINHLHYIKDAPLLVSHQAVIISVCTMKKILIFPRQSILLLTSFTAHCN